MLGALSMNTNDDASMMTILAHGTEYQKEKFPAAAQTAHLLLTEASPAPTPPACRRVRR